MEFIRDTISRYEQAFGEKPELLVTAPGRVNLLGEHTDYNDGFVLPVAINKHIYVAVGLRTDDEIHIHAIDLLKSIRFSIKELDLLDGKQAGAITWSSYPFGVVKALKAAGVPLRGCNISFRGTIPMGSGLSSSAAIEVAIASAIAKLYSHACSPLELIQLAQRAEVEFVGVTCGIMDQFIAVMGKKHTALFLDCRSLQHSYIPCPQGYKLVVCDTGVQRSLANSAYNQRRQECIAAVSAFRALKPGVDSLRDITESEFLEAESKLEPIIRKRARHVIFENARVQRGAQALGRGDIGEFGKLMIDSHLSLRDLYEVSCKELDAFVDIAVECEGVFGARMTGAGFGGCGICLVKEEWIDPLVERLRAEYPALAGRSMTIYVVGIEDGATIYNLKELNLPELVARLQ